MKPGRMTTPLQQSVPRPRTIRHLRPLLACLGLLGLLAINWLYLDSQRQHYRLFTVKDFSHHGWLAGRIVLGGGDPYQSRAWLRSHWTPEYEQEIGYAYVTGQITYAIPTRPGTVYNPEKLSDFVYPLWVAYVFSPFALVSVQWALALMMLLDEIALLIAVWCACRLLNFRPQPQWTVILLLLVFGFYPTLRVLQEGGFTLPVLAAFLAAVVLIRERRLPWLAGLLLALCTIKIQLVAIPFVFVGIWLLRQRCYAVIAAAALTAGVLWGVPTLLTPGWVAEWLPIVRLGNPTVYIQPTLWSLWVTFLGPYWWIVGSIVTSLLFVGLLWYWRADWRTGQWNTLPATFIIALPMTLFSWDYDQVFLLLPWLACWATAATGEAGSARLWRYVLILWILLLPLYSLLPIPRNQQQTYGLLLPATLLILYYRAHRPAPTATLQQAVQAGGRG